MSLLLRMLFLVQLLPSFQAKGQDIVCKRREREGGEVKKILESCSVPKSVVPGHLPTMQTFLSDNARLRHVQESLRNSFFIFTPVVLACVVPCLIVKPTRTGQEQARSLRPLSQVPGRGRQLFGELERRQGSHLPLLCLHHAPCRVRMQAKKGLARVVGACYQNNFSRLSLAVFLWIS